MGGKKKHRKTGQNRGNHRERGENIGKQRKTEKQGKTCTGGIIGKQEKT